MKHIILSLQERARTGFTDFVEIPYGDLAAVASGSPVNVALLDLAKGDVVLPRTLVTVLEACAGLMTGDTVTCSVGRTASSYVDFLAASNIISAGSAISQYTTYAPSTSIAAAAMTGTTTVYAQIALASGTTALSGLTAGKVGVYLNISRRSERPA